MATDVSSVVAHFPSAENGFTTTLASTISAGATTVPLNSLAGYTSGEIAVFVVDPSDAAKKQTFTGTVDTAGVQITNVIWTAGTNQTHTGGATVVDYATATHISMMSKGILVHADQDGTLKSGAVDVAAVLASNVVTTAKILDANVTAAKLAASAVTPEKLLSGTGTSWAWQAYTPTWTGSGGAPAINDGTLTGRYAQIGKTVHFVINMTAGAGTTFGSGNYRFSLPVTASGSFTLDTYIGTGKIVDAGTNNYHSFVALLSTTTVNMYYVSSTSGVVSEVGAAAPISFANGDYIRVSGTYEAA